MLHKLMQVLLQFHLLTRTPVTTLCRLQCSVPDVCTLPGALLY